MIKYYQAKTRFFSKELNRNYIHTVVYIHSCKEVEEHSYHTTSGRVLTSIHLEISEVQFKERALEHLLRWG